MKLLLSLAAGLIWGAAFAALNCYVSLLAIRKNKDASMLGANGFRIAIYAVALIIPVLLKDYLPLRMEMVLAGTAAALGLGLVWFAFQVASGKIK